jgi:CpeT protein
MIMRLQITTLLLLGFSSCTKPTPTTKPPIIDNVTRAQSFLTGRYDTKAQAEKDKDFFAIQLALCPIESTLGANVLYIEQAAVETPAEPYRQRLYVLSPGPEGQVISSIYEFKDPASVIGLCDAPRPINTEAVLPRTGCEVLLSWQGDHFTGKTGPKSCPSSLRGASYATTEVSLYQDKLISWDRGYDSSDKQVWGAVKSGYEFIKSR